MHRLPHAEDPTDHRRCERAEPYLSFRHSGNDRRFEDSERLQCLSRRQVDGMGRYCLEVVGGSLTLARSRMTPIGPLAVAGVPCARWSNARNHTDSRDQTRVQTDSPIRLSDRHLRNWSRSGWPTAGYQDYYSAAQGRWVN